MNIIATIPSVVSAKHPVFNRRIIFWSIVSALAGFLFGFDTVVISGAEQKIQALWGLSPALHGFAIGSALYGTVLGALFGGWPTDQFGRKKTLLCIGVLYVISALGCAFADGVTLFIIARLIGGIGIGISTVAAPLYISEIAPPAYRGRLAGHVPVQYRFWHSRCLCFQRDAGWHRRKCLALDAGRCGFPIHHLYSDVLWHPESPRWLIGRKGDRAAGLKVLKLIEPEATPAQVEADADAILAASSEASASAHFWTWRLRVPILLAFLVAFFNQLSGINAILYFAPRIFEMTGLGAKAALLQSVGIGRDKSDFYFRRPLAD